MKKVGKSTKKFMKGKLDRLQSFTSKTPALFFILPGLIGMCIFLILPYMDVFRRAFFSSAGTEFKGMENFAEVFSNEAFRLAVKNTVLFITACIPVLLILSLLIAIYIYNHSNIGAVFKTCFLVPMAIPIAAVVLLWKVFFDDKGILNGALNTVGIDVVDWMNTRYAFWVLVLSYIWKNIGYHIVLWIAGLSMISDDIYEAARIDGAREKTVFLTITLPNLRPMIFIIVVLALINSFKVFREVYLVAGNYPHESIYMIQHLFNNWFRDLSLNKMAAGAVMVSIVLITLICFLQKAWEKRE